MTPDEIARMNANTKRLIGLAAKLPRHRLLRGEVAGLGSGPEQTLAGQIRMLKLPEPRREYEFARPSRKWRFDFAWPELHIAVEVEGGVYIQGRHNRGKGFVADLSKYNEATLLGWTVIRVAPEHIDSMAAISWIERALEQSKEAA